MSGILKRKIEEKSDELKDEKKSMNLASGITLIALVITIIVILILAGVAISTLMGENGLINRTISAKEKTEQAGVQEELQIAINALAVDYYSSGAQGTLGEYVLNNVEELKKALGSEDVQIDADAKTITYKGNSFIIADDGTVKIKDGINLNKTSLTLQIIDREQSTETLTATLVNISGTITWTSSDSSVATVENGKVTTVGAGKTTITATCSGKTATCEVTVKSVVSISSITLSPTEGTVDEGSTLQVTATLNSGATEDVVWTSSDKSIATVAPSETESTIGIIKGIAPGGPVTIRASNTKGDVTAEFTLTKVNKVLPPVGDYVNYGVTYTDIYTEYPFKSTDGWRILKVELNSEDSSLYDVKLISTGVPAGLYYRWDNNNTESTDNNWWGTIKQVNSEYRLSLTSWSSDDSGYFAAYGLNHNFANIKFKVKPESFNADYYNYGYYIKINGKDNEEDLLGNEFIDSSLGAKVTGVHNLTLAELNIARGESETSVSNVTESSGDTGLFYLRGLAKENEDFKYTSSSTPYYWLALPYAIYATNLYDVGYSGSVDYDRSGGAFGVRPVVSISGIQLTNNNGVWQIGE